MGFFNRRPQNEDDNYTLFLLEDQLEEEESPEEGENEPLMFFGEEAEAADESVVIEPETEVTETVVEPINTDWHDTIESFAEPTEDEPAKEATEAVADGRPQHAAAKKGEIADPEKCKADLKTAGLLIEEYSAADINAAPERIGFPGSPTKVKQVMSVVLTAGEAKTVSADAEGIAGLMHELISDHTLG